MSKKLGVISLALAAVSLCLSLFMFVRAGSVTDSAAQETQSAADVQYVLYLGTNDKDTNTPKFSEEEAKAKLDTILTKYFEGFTIQEATGGWTNEDGSVSHEYTLVIYLSDTTLDKVHAASDELLEEYNQSTVLIQANETVAEFYSGKG